MKQCWIQYLEKTPPVGYCTYRYLHFKSAYQIPKLPFLPPSPPTRGRALPDDWHCSECQNCYRLIRIKGNRKFHSLVWRGGFNNARVERFIFAALQRSISNLIHFFCYRWSWFWNTTDILWSLLTRRPSSSFSRIPSFRSDILRRPLANMELVFESLCVFFLVDTVV